jgi:hypothetical protein
MTARSKARRANIPAQLRERFEFYGEDVLAHAVGAGEHSSKGPELDRLLRENRTEILEWLREQAAARERKETHRFYWILFWTIIAAVAATIAASEIRTFLRL